MSEFAFAVRPRKTVDVVRIAEQFLSSCRAENLSAARPLDLARVVEQELPRRRVEVYPVPDDELPGAEAETRAGTADWLEIWMREVFYDALFTPTYRTVRARSTVAHEIGHAFLHTAELRAGRHAPQLLAMKRAERKKLQAFEDSEWQAHTFAGALLLPVSTLRNLGPTPATQLASAFGVSEPFVTSHLRRVRKLL